MKCPYCGYSESKVIDSRPTDEGERIRRRRECLNCEKRPVPLETLERIVDEIETLLQNSLDREVPSTLIGTYAMDKLKKVDEVAYVRFASVYREFKDINTFMDELNKIKAERNR